MSDGAPDRTRFVAVAALLFAAIHLLVPLPSLALASVLVLFLFVVPAALARRADGSLELLTVLALAPLSIATAAALRAGLVTAGLAPASAARATSLGALALSLRLLWPMVANVERPKDQRKESGHAGGQQLDRRLVVGCIVGALLLALPLLSTRVLVSWHGYFHAALTEQVAARGLPATNPGLAGEPINYQWAFHAIPALVAETAAIDPLRALLGLNIAWIVIAGLGAAELARTLGLSRPLQRLAPLALFGAINTAAPLVLLAKRLLFASLPANDWDRGEWIDWLAQRAIPRNDGDIARSLWDVRASAFAKEFLDASAMATGLVLFVVALALAVEAARAPRRRTWLLAPLAMVGAFVYPQLLPVVVVAIVALALVHLLPRASEPAARPRFALALVGACALAILVASPYLAAITSRARFVSGAEVSPLVALESPLDLWRHAKRLLAFAALLPFLLPAAVAFKAKWREPQWRALTVVAAAALVLSIAVRMQQGTEYKFLFAAGVPLALIALLGLEVACARARPGIKRTLFVASALYLAGPTLVFLIGALASGHFREQPIALHGRTFTRTSASASDAALELIREKTPPDTVLVAPLVASRKSPNNDGFAPSALAARDLYVADDVELTRRSVAFDERARIAAQLLEGRDVATATAALQSLHRPIALLLAPPPIGADPAARIEPWKSREYAEAGWRDLDRGDGVRLLFLPSSH